MLQTLQMLEMITLILLITSLPVRDYSPILFYRSNLIFWIVMRCGIADLSDRKEIGEESL